MRDAVRLDPMSENSWFDRLVVLSKVELFVTGFCGRRFHLGKVLEALGEYDKACDCMATALQVQMTSPVVPFSAVPICFD